MYNRMRTSYTAAAKNVFIINRKSASSLASCCPGRELIASRTGRDSEHVINHPAANSSVRPSVVSVPNNRKKYIIITDASRTTYGREEIP